VRVRAPRQVQWLDQFLAVRLAGAGAVARRELDQACRAGGRPLREILVLAVASGQPGLSIGSVADRLGLQRSEVSRLVPDLVEEGWLELGPNLRDDRSRVLVPNPGAERIVAASTPVLKAVDRRLRSNLTGLRQRQLGESLEALKGPRSPVADVLAGL
jgi:DNA-binding MarR family transcriptional regulator